MKVIMFPPPGFTGDQWLEPPVGLNFDNYNNWNRPWIMLKDKINALGLDLQCWPCEYDKKTDFGVYCDTPRYPAPALDKSVMFTIEPPVVAPRQWERMQGLPFTRILCFGREFVDNKKVFYLPHHMVEYKSDKTIVRDKKIVAVYSNKLFHGPNELYTARRQQILSWGKDLDLYGPGWGEDSEMIATVNYCGKWNGNKTDLLRQYKYNINYENMYFEGYASEKWGDAIQAGCIPVRRGWEPDFPIEQNFEGPWTDGIMQHIKEIIGEK